MYTFENKETERYFYDVAQKYGIMHVNMEDGAVMKKEDVDCLVRVCSESVEKYCDKN